MTSPWSRRPCRCRRPPSRIGTDRVSPPGVRRAADAVGAVRWLGCGLWAVRSRTAGDRRAHGRWAAVREPVLDTTGAVLLWTAMAVDLATRPLAAGQSASTPAAYLWAALIAGPFAVHRRFPVIAILVSDLGLLGYSLGRYSAFPGYATFALVFAVALHAGRRRALAVYLAGVAGLIGALSLQPAGVATASSWISTLLTVTVAWLAGENLRSRRARRQQELDEAHRQAEQRAEEARRLIQQQAEEERRAVGAERLRIARDLHDVVAHSMSVIAVQAGAAHHVIDDRPEVARAALGSIEVTAREGLVEMRRMLGVLRSEDDATASAPTTPAEGLRDIDRLLSHFRAAGLQLQVNDDGAHRRSPGRARHLGLPDHPGRPHQRAPPRRTRRPPGHSTITHPAADRHPR